MPDNPLPAGSQPTPESSGRASLWLYENVEREYEAIQQYLAGRLGKLEYSDAAGRAAVLYEHLRHVHEFFPRKEVGPTIPLEKKICYEARFAEAIYAPGSPLIPFIYMAPEDQDNIILYFQSGQPSVRIADLRYLASRGILKKLQAKEEELLAQRRFVPGRMIPHLDDRRRVQARIEIVPGLEAIVLLLDQRAGPGANTRDWKRFQKENARADISAKKDFIAHLRSTDPRLFLKRLAAWRLLILEGSYKAARKWTLGHQVLTSNGNPIPWYNAKGKLKPRRKYFSCAPYCHRKSWEAATQRATALVESLSLYMDLT